MADRLLLLDHIQLANLARLRAIEAATIKEDSELFNAEYDTAKMWLTHAQYRIMGEMTTRC